MSYFLVEYNFGDADGRSDDYTATKALPQSKKIALQNNFMACMYTAASVKIAGTEISLINSAHAQAAMLKSRLGYTTDFMESIGPDLNGYDPDFSKRLSRFCRDGVYHRDGLIDCSPNNSQPISSSNLQNVILFNKLEQPLVKGADGKYPGTNQDGSAATPATGDYLWIFADQEGSTKIPHTSDKSTTNAGSLIYTLPSYSFSASGNPGTDAAVADGTKIYPGDRIRFVTEDSKFNAVEFYVQKVSSAATNKAALLIVPTSDLNLQSCIDAVGDTNKAKSGIASVMRYGVAPQYQTDPRSNVVNNTIVYQPPLSFFECEDPNVFYGDMQIQLTPNSNWRKAAIESSNGGYYSDDVTHGTDYVFGIKSMRLYLARCKITEPIRSNPTLTVSDMLIANKALPSGASNIDFIVPPSTQKIAIWIQDTSAGTNGKIPLTRFKTRQFTGTTNKLNLLNQYGPWAHTYDEHLHSLQVTFAGITKPISNFQRGGVGNGQDATVNSMLQRWLMTNQNNDNNTTPEKFHDWLSMGPYYLFDFSRSSDNLGTYLQVKIHYDGSLPTQGASDTDTTPSNVNLYVCAFYKRDIGLSYGSYGNILNAQTQMA